MSLQGDHKTRLETWKAVSAYLGCDERTVRRWQAERGLPIHRRPGGRRGDIFADVAELESWRRETGAEGPTDGLVQPAARGVVQDLYARGMRAWEERTPASLNQALDAFNAALRIDPDHAEALAGLANTFILLREYTQMPDAQAYPLARDAARRALAIDDGLPQAHAALGFVEYWGFWDAESAERAFELAIALDPGLATSHHWFATFLAARGRFGEALAQIERALQIDPSSLAMQSDRGLLLFHAGRPDEAIAELRRLAAKAPGLGSPHRYLAVLHLIGGSNEDYLSEARLMAALVNDHTELAALAAAEAAYRASGRAAMLAVLAADRTERARSGAASAYSVAWLNALAGDAAATMAWLHKSFDKREAEFVQIVFEQAFHGLSHLPEFKALAAQVAPQARRRFASTRGLGGELAGILDRSPRGLILVNPDGRLRFANLAAERLLAEAGGLRAVGGRLTAARPEDARRLQEMIGAAGRGDGRGGGCMAIATPSRHSPLSVTATPMEPGAPRTLGGGGFVLVCATDLDAGVVLPEQQLRELFGLTAAEARLARALFEGLSTSEAAAELGLSRNTVHVQLGRIFEKTGVNRQSALMRLMMRAAGVDLI